MSNVVAFLNETINLLIRRPAIDRHRSTMLVTTSQHMSPIMRFGGSNAVIIADIYTGAVSPIILYLVDTVAIPTRYHLQALHPVAVRLEDALIALAQRCIAAGSVLVLGPRLQHAVCVEELRQRLHDDGLVRTLVAFDVLKRFDRRHETPNEDQRRPITTAVENERHPVFDVTDNFDEMSKRPVGICSVACRLIGHLVEVMEGDGTGAIAQQQQLANVDWWLVQSLQRLLDVANALSDQRMLDVAALGDRRVCWLLLGVYSAL